MFQEKNMNCQKYFPEMYYEKVLKEGNERNKPRRGEREKTGSGSS
jgi:hypothetical protein